MKDRQELLNVVRSWWRWFRYPKWTPTRVRIVKRQAFWVGDRKLRTTEGGSDE